MRSYAWNFLPFIAFLLISILLFKSLTKDDRYTSASMINKPFPDFYEYDLQRLSKIITRDDLLGVTTLVHVWSSSCNSCSKDNVVLLKLANSKKIKLIGINYLDDREAALDFLNSYGNPYSKIIFDATGNLSMRIGAYGVPETYIVDKKGIIRYKLSSGLNDVVLETKLFPIINRLKKS
ncbi:MAG: DsbE family thiol:disulfide interchange protein [Legionellales bacterium]|jgi:cytochrome c biogenesis protein CcmG, thiol:disulfide interchange protein DsbE|nr:DsbE family thiol:disulfide interchange protein [Legionellales bacterium]